MSHLSTNTKIEYVAVYYYWDREKGNIPNSESGGWPTEEEAIDCGEVYVKEQVEQYGRYAWATIEKRVVPIYE